MLLTLMQEWPCTWVISVTIDGVWPNLYTDPLDIPAGTVVEVSIQYSWDNCCFDQWYNKKLIVSTEQTFTTTVGDNNETYLAVSVYCAQPQPQPQPCAPRYKDINTLLSKANCICKEINVVTMDWPNNTDVYAIIDNCIPEDPAANPFGLGFHIILALADPNYILQTVECICANRRSDPAYIYQD